jgi:predicted nucleotidyltransferase
VNTTSLLEHICSDLRVRGHAHTILLYGSRATGTENKDSDYDIAAFAERSNTLRDTRVVAGQFLDVFLYSETVLASPSVDYLKLRQSVVLLQRGNEANEFLAGLETIFRKGPEPLSADEILARRTWAWKMVRRIERNDVEGNYRRAWLLTALLEDYFVIRGRWFEGPKTALRWLLENDPVTRDAFEVALQPGAPIAAIRNVVGNAVGESPH